eukprot:1159054-Pelagomonas_calceolata.AAC.5
MQAHLGQHMPEILQKAQCLVLGAGAQVQGLGAVAIALPFALSTMYAQRPQGSVTQFQCHLHESEAQSLMLSVACINQRLCLSCLVSPEGVKGQKLKACTGTAKVDTRLKGS